MSIDAMPERPDVPRRFEAPKRTRLASLALDSFCAENRFVFTRLDLFCRLFRILSEPGNMGLRRKVASLGEVSRRVIKNLKETGGVIRDPDYGAAYRVLSLGDGPADEVCALASPLGYISRLSAMQYWGLTDRSPESLHITMPAPSVARALLERHVAEEMGVALDALPEPDRPKLSVTSHPESVRGRPVSVHFALHPGSSLRVRGKWARLATVGQTFLDMLEDSSSCGGMDHVRTVWREHAATYREDIIATIDQTASPIAKIRAGYFLDEMLKIGDDPRVQGWVVEAKWGGSRVLDPTKPLGDNKSYKWMISINV